MIKSYIQYVSVCNGCSIIHEPAQHQMECLHCYQDYLAIMKTNDQQLIGDNNDN